MRLAGSSCLAPLLNVPGPARWHRRHRLHRGRCGCDKLPAAAAQRSHSGRTSSFRILICDQRDVRQLHHLSTLGGTKTIDGVVDILSQQLIGGVAVLTSDDPSATFSTAEVRAALVSLGHCWSRGTVRDLFEDETSAVKGRLLRVRRGVFRVRGEDQRALSVTGRAMAPVRDHVHAAMRQLAAEGRKRVTRAEVQERLAPSGARYSQGAVLQGLLQLRQAIPAVVVLGPDQRYWLVAQ